MDVDDLPGGEALWCDERMTPSGQGHICTLGWTTRHPSQLANAPTGGTAEVMDEGPLLVGRWRSIARPARVLGARPLSRARCGAPVDARRAASQCRGRGALVKFPGQLALPADAEGLHRRGSAKILCRVAHHVDLERIALAGTGGGGKSARSALRRRGHCIKGRQVEACNARRDCTASERSPFVGH